VLVTETMVVELVVVDVELLPPFGKPGTATPAGFVRAGAVPGALFDAPETTKAATSTEANTAPARMRRWIPPPPAFERDCIVVLVPEHGPRYYPNW
jgi:hypothetical protein